MEDRAPQLMDVLSEAFRPSGGPLDGDAFEMLLGRLQWVHLRGKEFLFSRGEASDRLYVVVAGRLRAVGPDQSGREMTRDLGVGEVIGEMGVVAGEPRSMSVFAVRDSDLVSLSRTALEELISRHPQLMMGILSTVIRRLRLPAGSQGEAGATCATLALVPLGDSVPAGEFSRRLAKALGAMGAARLLDQHEVETLSGVPGGADFPPGTPEGERLLDCLNQQEAAHEFLVFLADLDHVEWTRRCLRQADHVLLVAMAADDPRPGGREADLVWKDHGPTSARKSLALIHPDGSSLPTGTERWLEGRDLHRHYHVRGDSPADDARLARSLAERGIGLVLGGGGARGFAQIGVIRALRESGIPIDLVGGTSMGSIIAAACAMGWDSPTMIRLGLEAFVESKAFKEYTLPIVSLIRGDRLERVTRKIFGETRIEDLWIPQFSVSCNLTSSEAVIHRRGLLWRALRASGSLPGVLAPVLEEGQLLVDGGVLDNLPGGVMRSLSGGPVIVVDVSPAVDLRADCERVPSPWQMVRSRLVSRKRPSMPGIVDILMRATTLTSARVASSVRGDADLYLHPPVESYGLLEFEAIEKIAEDGYAYAMSQIESLGGPEGIFSSNGLG